MIARPVDSLTHSLELVHQLTRGRGGFADRMDGSEVDFEQQVNGTDITRYQEFAEAGNEVEIRLESGGWHCRLVASDGRAFSLEAGGPYEDAFADDPAIDGATTAINAQDVSALLRIWAPRTAQVRVTLRNWPERSGFHWFRTTSAFLAALSSSAWIATVTQIWGIKGTHRLTLQDAADAVILTPGAVVHGPDAYPSAPQAPADDQLTAAYRRVRLHDLRSELPAPPKVIPENSQANDELSRMLIGLAGQLVWCWLARDVTVDANGMVVRFEGARIVEFRLRVRPIGSSEPSLELWRWAVSTTDPAQVDALQQAISLAVTGPGDLIVGARPALRTARTLYELARRGSVAEALATRRSARESAVTTATDAGNAATASAAKTFDRVVVQIAAIAAILIAQANDLIRPDITRNLLALIAALVVVLGLLVFGVDFPGARAMLHAFGEDLKEYRDTLSEDDLDAVRRLQSIAKAKKAILRAQIGTALLLLTTFAFALIVRVNVK